MADLKSMFNKMNKTNGDSGDSPPAPKNPTKKKNASNNIENTYQKKTQLEHILLRPDTYIGSVENNEENMWIYDQETESMQQRKILFTPGLYKIFDEILVNAADNKQRDESMDCIKIEIKQEENTISVWNNGEGIPVVMHKNENMYVPTMIFGHLLTSSNYNDEEEKVTGGRNGYGAKLCNIFSTKFTVETASSQYGKQFKQTWASNMTKTSDARVTPFKGTDFTKVTFTPDLAKFQMDKLDDGIVGLMSRRAFDIAASTRGVKVFLNGKRVPVKGFKDYVELYTKTKKDDHGNPLKIIYERCNERWEVAVTVSDGSFQQMSFVNSIATTKGGRHVEYVTDLISKQIVDVVNKRNKGGVTIKPTQVKNHMWIFINCLVVNPSFDSQTKENMTLQMKNFGSKCTLSDKFIPQVVKCGLVEAILSWAKAKAMTVLEKHSGKKKSKLKGIAKLEDANEAGTRNALKCTLILTEGDSAKSLAVSGLGVIGRDYYGVFPLRGKLLNVREATHKQILENAEINNLIQIVGLHYKKKYNTEADMKTLRYGKIMIMTDQDQDGSHIKGLLINFIHYNWPELLRQDFLEEFITPIVKARKKNQELSFYSMPEFEEWKNNTANQHTFSIKYYKGLGTSTSVEAKEYFTNMARHRIRFRYQGPQDDDHIVLAFSRKHIEQRKEWLTNFMVESRRRKELGLQEKYLYTKGTKSVTYTDFVNLELVLFSNADNIRSIPSMVDGFKPGQRKVLFTCLKRNDKKEVKVAQLAGSVAEHSCYHHGEVSLCLTIVNLAQNFVGSNNINVLEPRGQFGTRLVGGKDSASPRYIFTLMSPLTRMIFHPHDDGLLKHEYDDNQKIEPVWYIPILPMLLVNGADGIGTGWMTKIPNFNPRDLVNNIRRKLDGEETVNIIPFYKNFKGNIEYCGEGRYCVSGEISLLGNDRVEITELPVGTWTQNYKENVLEVLLHGSEKTKSKPILSDYKEYNTDTSVKFVLTFLPGELRKCEKESLHKVLKLQTLINMSSMCAFDELGCLKRFDSVADIFDEYYTLRLNMYVKRKDFLEGMLEAEAKRLSNQARFIMQKCSNDLVVENKKRKTIVDELIKREYDPDPVQTWKQKNKSDEEEAAEQSDQEEEGEEEEEEEGASKKKPKVVDPEKAFKSLSDVKKFDYLLGMSMWMLTDERKNELLKQRDTKLAELDVLKRKTNGDLWREDLDAFMAKLDEVQQKEVDAELGKGSKKKTLVAGKKKNLQETLPSPSAKRILPVISEDLKKRVKVAALAKEKRINKDTVKMEVSVELDEFDEMVNDTKTLAEKLGMSNEGEKKPKGRAKKATDGMKQTKLNFSAAPAKEVNGTAKRGRKKKVLSDGDDAVRDDNDIISDEDIKPVVVSPATRVRRAAAAKVVYNLDDSDENCSRENSHQASDESEPELFDNTAVIENSFSGLQEKMVLSDSDEDKPVPRHESSEDMFDSLVGKKSGDSDDKDVSHTSLKRKLSDSESGTDVGAQITGKPKAKAKKTEPAKKKAEPAKKKAPVKKTVSDSDSSPKTKAKGGRKKVVKSSDGSGSDSDFKPSEGKRTARAAAANRKRVFEDSDSESD